ncbi:acyl carrier protein [Octadecabacter sp. CECT 8868]|uniref:acyl carrier protein n=1 Tax=Octadecabacter algicola TaxID=2909342 RepID=UPI001F32D31F|nr:acyl carrier protein [Octadecabacter algicola]MCF2906698.1 acyl carrier protein [Octadecabacter algicola]
MAISRSDLTDFLEEEVGVDTDDLQDDTPLFSTGLVDSFALVTLMMQLETLGGFRIKPAEVTLENLDTLERILAYVKKQEA